MREWKPGWCAGGPVAGPTETLGEEEVEEEEEGQEDEEEEEKDRLGAR